MRTSKHSKMFSLPKLIVLLLAFISHEYEAIGQYVIPYTSMVIPVNKHTDAATPLYSVQVVTAWEVPHNRQANLLIDIDAPFSWHECMVQWNIYPGSCHNDMLCESPVSCEEFQCTEVRTSYSYKNPSCPPESNSSTLPGWGYCSCPVNVVNPVTGKCSQALLNYENMFVRTSNGRNPFDGFDVPTPNAACVSSPSFESFPANVSGVMSFSTSRYALQEFFYQVVKRALALCLPSTTSTPGVMFYGDGPYNFHPHTDVDIRNFLSYTPLLKHPDSFGYFIGVNAILIKRRSIKVPSNTTCKLSTIEPYSTLRTDIYNQVIKRFSMVTKQITPAKPVRPFGLCFKSVTNGTRFGLKFPDIEFILQDGKTWTISAANSIKQVTKDVVCLAFVDGGAASEHAIVIGTFQFEDNFLLFDLEKSTFGFSSSLLSKQTSCANFNFTIIASS